MHPRLRHLALPALALAALTFAVPTADARPREDGAPAAALGMGDAIRATAVGTNGLFYNPAGIRLLKSYSFEGAYGFSGGRKGHTWTLGGVDARTNPAVAMGIAATYIDTEEGGHERSGYRMRGGLASGTEWSGGSLQFGVGVHYLDLHRELLSQLDPDSGGTETFLTFDAGIVLDIGGVLRLAAVGQNLVDTKAAEAPRIAAFGVTAAMGRMELSFDTELDLDSDPDKASPTYSVGTQILLGGNAVTRSGFTMDSVTGDKRVSGGIGYVSREVALDLGISKELEGDAAWMISAAMRYYLP